MTRYIGICIIAILTLSSNLAISWSLFETYQECLDEPKAYEDWIDRTLRCTRKHQDELPKSVFNLTTRGARITTNHLKIDLKTNQAEWLVSELTISLAIDNDVTNYTTHTMLIKPYESYSISLPIKTLESKPKKGSWSWAIISGKGVKVK